MHRNQWTWTLGPSFAMAAVIVALWFAHPDGTDPDMALLIEQLVVAIALIAVVVVAGRGPDAGWTRSKGLAWLWLAGPIWLAIVTPVGLAAANIVAAPRAALVWFVSSALIGLNEETVFRGFLLGGLRKRFGPLASAVLSSILFGLMHLLNALVGADSHFLMAQILAASGSGLLLSAVTLRSGSVWPAVFLHFAGDAIGLSAMGGFEAAVQTREAAAGMLVFGSLCALWGAFWIWHLARRGKLESPGLATRPASASAGSPVSASAR